MLQIPDCEINHNAIVVVGYNRIVSIKRLLKSLQEAYYASIAVPLVVSIDKSDCTELYDFVENFFCVVMFGLINVNILYYSFSTLYQMCNLRQSL